KEYLSAFVIFRICHSPIPSTAIYLPYMAPSGSNLTLFIQLIFLKYQEILAINRNGKHRSIASAEFYVLYIFRPPNIGAYADISWHRQPFDAQNTEIDDSPSLI